MTKTSTIKCPKTEVTVTDTVRDGKTTTIYTETFFPAPSLVFKTKKTLTTTVPAACATLAYEGGDNPNGEPGDFINVFTVYPYFPQTDVDCCVLCYDSVNFPNCIASAFISDALQCELLQKVNATAGEKTSKKCPIGIENYDFGVQSADGFIYPGPCGR